MKTFAVFTPGAPDSSPHWQMIADSAISPWRRPLFLPGWDTDFRLFFSPAVCVERLGKGIAARFAHRYYSRAAWGWNMRACDLYRTLMKQGAPPDAAVNFDCAAMHGPMTDFRTIAHMCAAGVKILRNGLPTTLIMHPDLAACTDSIIELLSRHNTLKTGDIIFPILPSEGLSVKQGDILTLLSADGETIHNLRVK